MPKPYLDININAELSNEMESEIIQTFIRAFERLDADPILELLDDTELFERETTSAFKTLTIEMIDFAKAKGYDWLEVKKGKCFGCNRNNEPHEFYSKSGYFVFAIMFHNQDGKLSQISECDYSSGSGRVIPRMSDHS